MQENREKKYPKRRKGAVEAQQIYGASSQLAVEKSSAYSLVCLHTGEIKKKIKKHQNPAAATTF